MKLKLVAQFNPDTETPLEAEYVAVWNDRAVLSDYEFSRLKEMVRPENIRSNLFWHPLYTEIMGVAVTYGLEIGDTFHPPEDFK